MPVVQQAAIERSGGVDLFERLAVSTASVPEREREGGGARHGSRALLAPLRPAAQLALVDEYRDSLYVG